MKWLLRHQDDRWSKRRRRCRCVPTTYSSYWLLLWLFLIGLFLQLLPFLGVTATQLQAALILPHGDAAWDPSLYDHDPKETRDAAHSIATAARRASAWFTNSNIFDLDVILVVSPHGVALSNDFGIVLNAQASGSVEIGHDRRNASSSSSSSYAYTVDLPPVELAFQFASDLVQYLTVKQGPQNVTGLQFPESPAVSMLRWAEVIPLLLLQEQQQRQPRYMIWTQPLRRHEHSGISMIPELLQLGHQIRHWMDTTLSPDLAWGVLVSGDLSHTHTSDSPYTVDPVASQSLDAAIGAWANSKNVCDDEASAQLLHTAAAWQNRGLSCGFTGFVLLHGLLCGDGSNSDPTSPTSTTTRPQSSPATTTSWRSQVLVNRNVTYFGMMVAQFSRQEDGNTLAS